MRASLTDLLRDRRVGHPTRIVQAEIASGELRLTVEGWRWWDQAGGHGDHDGRIEFTFSGLTGGLLDGELLASRTEDEALANLSVHSLADEPWPVKGHIYEIYCQGPLTDPLTLHALVHDVLLGQRAPCTPFDYMNGGPTLARFRALAEGNNYLLSRAPGAMHAIIRAEVERQGVPHTVLVAEYPPATGLLVILGDAAFTCAEAWAEWDAAAAC